jgi:hypothetical protein
MKSVRVKAALMFGACASVFAIFLSAFSWQQTVREAREKARTDAEQLMARTVEAFVVSTRGFHGDFSAASDAVNKRKKLDEWNRTFTALNSAISHDFGKDRNRVRLIGDKETGGYPPLGGQAVAPQISFETAAMKALGAGTALHVAEDGDVLRFAAPLWSDAHPGCAACHVATIEGLDASPDRKLLLGSLNVYVPLQESYAQARSRALVTIVAIALVFAALIALSLWYLSRKVFLPVRQLAINLDAAAIEVDTGANSIASGSQELARTAAVQATAVEKAAEATERTSHSAQANQQSCLAAEDSVRNSGQQLAEVQRASVQTVVAMQNLKESGGAIGKIVRMIEEIAFQTNLLA